MCPTRRVPLVGHPHGGVPSQEDRWLSSIQQWRPPAAQTSSSPAIRQSSSTTPKPPPAPSTPNCQRGASRAPPLEKGKHRENYWTIEPRALWAKDTGGTAQEEALLTKQNKLDYNKHVISAKGFERSRSWHLACANTDSQQLSCRATSWRGGWRQ